MKIAITGSNGFIGNACCEYLAARSHNVFKIKRKKFLSSSEINLKNSIFDLDNFPHDVDVVIHCAGLVHQKNKKRYSYERYHKVNAFSSYDLAVRCSQKNVKKFIFISTIKVNGESTSLNNPFKDPFFCNPLDYYSLSKLNAENYIRDLSLKTNLQTFIIRPPLVYGEDVKANFRTLLNLIYRRFPLPFQKIKNKRSFLYIQNLCDFIYKLVLDESLAKSNTFLLSDAESLSTKKLIKLISNGFGYEPNLFTLNESILNLFSSLLGKKEALSKLTNSLEIDPNLSYDALNWIPPFTIEEGIYKTSKWFKTSQENL